MGEADKFFNIMLGYERIKTMFVSVFIGIFAFLLTLMYLSQLYDKYYDVHYDKPDDVDLLNIKYTLVIIVLWIISILMFKLRNNRTYQKFDLFMDITRR
jgi:multisubunit Na+/H+ antiporter MnhB subunit